MAPNSALMDTPRGPRIEEGAELGFELQRRHGERHQVRRLTEQHAEDLRGILDDGQREAAARRARQGASS